MSQKSVGHMFFRGCTTTYIIPYYGERAYVVSYDTRILYLIIIAHIIIRLRESRVVVKFELFNIIYYFVHTEIHLAAAPIKIYTYNARFVDGNFVFSRPQRLQNRGVFFF